MAETLKKLGLERLSVKLTHSTTPVRFCIGIKLLYKVALASAVQQSGHSEEGEGRPNWETAIYTQHDSSYMSTQPTHQ